MRVQKVNFKTLSKVNNNGRTYKDFSLKNLTTFKIGGNCDYYLEIHTLENFIKIMDYLRNTTTKFFVLGNGSNILISDKGFQGVVLRLKGDFDRIESREEFVEVGSGVLLPKLYSYTLEHFLSGMEEGGLIPATIGGAIYMNAQTGSYVTSNLVEFVVAYNCQTGKIDYLKNEECEFSHKKSIFQNGNYIILRAGLKFERGNKKDISEKHHNALVYRKNNHPIEFPSAGCVFKKFNDLNISKMLDDLGIKGRRIGGAYVSEKHANFVLSDNASASDVLKLIKEIEQKFYEKYNLNLQREIILLGDFDET